VPRREVEAVHVRPAKKFNLHKPTGVLVFLHGAISQPAPAAAPARQGCFGPAVESLGLIVLAPSTYEKVEWETRRAASSSTSPSST